MADGRFGCEADIAGPATGSTRSLVTRSVPAADVFHSVKIDYQELRAGT